jgi:predicted dehydrogenase
MSLSVQIPDHPWPIYIIGAGGIVHDAHLPAYQLAGFPVKGIFDIDTAKANAVAAKFGIDSVYARLEDMLQQVPRQAVWDVAVPGAALPEVLQQLPTGAAVLMQKPMGEDLAAARKILQVCREKKFTAGVNFQLRYAPFVVEARKMIDAGVIGTLTDIEVHVTVHTPWQLWKFLYTAPRVEILYHSIHYIDLVRSFLGNPGSVYAKTLKHPAMKELASVRSTIIMDYGDMVRANIFTNHTHVYGPQHQQSYVKWEGTKGAIKATLGVLKNYPHGEQDTFEYTYEEAGQYGLWKSKHIEGSWFPHAFIGSMAQVMLAAQGVIARPDNSVEDVIHTMACVEAAYVSSDAGGTRIEM